MGWLTSEELKWNDAGRLVSDGPSTYKIPAFGDLPPTFNVELLEGTPIPRPASTAPRLWASRLHARHLGLVGTARRLASLVDYRESPALDTPATPERVLMAAETLRRRAEDATSPGDPTMPRHDSAAAGAWHAALDRLQRQARPHALASVVARRGPRHGSRRQDGDHPDSVHDTLGGGSFEFQVIDVARAALAGGEGGSHLEAFPLGGRSGQCCGGYVHVLIEVFTGAEMTVALFGAGHVGRALVEILAPLPWRLLWFDSRDDAFPNELDHHERLSCRRIATGPEASTSPAPWTRYPLAAMPGDDP